MCSPNISFAKYSSTCLRSAKDTFSSMYKPLLDEIYNEHGQKCHFINPSRRERPNWWFVVLHVPYLHRGGMCSQQYIRVGLNKKVSCMSRAGCSCGKFKAVKLCQSSPISGPSDKLKPMRPKISTISFFTNDKGCLLPS